jgi:hypothetical protein
MQFPRHDLCILCPQLSVVEGRHAIMRPQLKSIRHTEQVVSSLTTLVDDGEGENRDN